MNTLTRFAVLAILAGCSTTPHYDARFGDAVRQAKLAMTIYPDASANTDPVAGIDGQAATAAIAKYHGIAKEAPATTINLNTTAR